MKSSDVRTTIDRALEQLASDLDQGKSQAFLEYLSAMARFHSYSFHNVCLILSQCPSATRVAGFRTWLTFSRYVRKGEKGIAIFAPMFFKARSEGAPFDANCTHEEKDDKGRILRFRVVYVFDISQTEGEALPEPQRVHGSPVHYLADLLDYIASLGISVYRDPDLAGMDGVSEGLRIRIRTGLSPAEEFAVLVHELAHERLHRGPEGRAMTATERETEAEAVAYVVCQAIGLEAGRACSDYIAAYRGDRETLSKALTRVQTLAGQIIDELTGEAEAAAQAAALLAA